MNTPMRSALTLLQILALATPARALAQPAIPPVEEDPLAPAARGEATAEAPAPETGDNDTRGFEAGFVAGQTLYDRGQYLAAARTWTESVLLLPEGPEHRDNRAAVAEYIAEAYSRALSVRAPREQIEEAVAVLDRYVAEVGAAYGPDAPVGPKVTATRKALRERLTPRPAVVESAPEGPQPAPSQPTPPAPKVRALAITGGLGLGLGVGGFALFAASAVQAKGLERRFDEQARGCDLGAPSPECSEIIRAGRAAQTQAIAGAVIGSVGLVTGATLVALAARRRAHSAAFTPRVGPGFAGVGLSGKF